MLDAVGSGSVEAFTRFDVFPKHFGWNIPKFDFRFDVKFLNILFGVHEGDPAEDGMPSSVEPIQNCKSVVRVFRFSNDISINYDNGITCDDYVEGLLKPYHVTDIV